MANEPVQISKIEDGMRLLRWFLRHFPAVSQGTFYKLCRGGQIRINSSRCRGTEILRSGDFIRIPPTISRQPSAVSRQSRESGDRFSLKDLEYLRKCIIHNDDDIVAFNKPAGLATQGGTGIKMSVDKMAAALFPYDKISLVHRLDRETSGVLVVAKNTRAAQKLSEEFQNKTARKEYLALLAGNVLPKSGVIDNYMVKGRVLEQNEKAEPGAKPLRAITKYRVLGGAPGVASWVLFAPMTGRTHQLRLHSAFSLNAPIVGDTLYQSGERRAKSGDNAALQSMLATNNLFLFAHKITFQHPGTGRAIAIRAELPDFMKPVVKFLELTIPD
ncbi:MAG: RluA family pseudouridine synthase [Rickettsiales bacterium]|jgi:23S rRNA pseudouridine955/2504/2580 synthase|nr:RluA family pseudouridine synthase [Rickettsiales bacterium]